MAAIPSLPVRGRDAHLAVLDFALRQTAAGVGTVVVIEGGPGLGKTRMLQAAWAAAGNMGFRMGRGMADPTGGVVDLSPLMEALFEHVPPLLNRSLLSDVHSAREQRFWLLRDIEALLNEAATLRPLLIVLDDLHWADSGTAVALRLLPQRLAGMPIAWVLATRPAQGTAQVRAVLAELVENGADLLRLEPLDATAIAQIMADVLAAAPGDELLQRAAGTNGNPFLLVDLIRGLEEEGIITVESGRAMLTEDRAPGRVTDDMRIRLSRLPASAERAAIAAASLGRRFSVVDLAAISDVSVPDLLSPVEVLMAADIFAESDDRLSFGHDLIRDAVRASVPNAMRRALDRRGADVLLSRGALSVEVATQLAASAEAGDEVAIQTLADAVERLGATDPAAAAELAERALALMAGQHPLRGPLVSRRAISLFAAGSGDEAKRYADTVLRQALPPEQEAQVRLSIASMFVLSPDVRADSATKALALPGLSEDLRAWLEAIVLHNLVVAGRSADAQELAPVAAKGAEVSASREAKFAVELATAGLEYQLFAFGSALAHLDTAGRIGTSEDTRARLAHFFRGWPLAALDSFDAARSVAADGIAAAQRDRQNWALHIFETWTGLLSLQCGRLSDAAAVLEGRFAVNDARGIVGVIDAAHISGLALLAIHAGNERAARDVSRTCETLLNATAPAVRRHAAWALAAFAMAQGLPERAHSWLCALGQSERLSVFPLFPHDVANDAEIVRIGIAVGDFELVASTVSVAEQRMRLNPGALSLEAAVMHTRGLMNRSPGDLAAAVALLKGTTRRLALMSALEDLGRTLVDEGTPTEGIDALDEALGIAADIGAAWDAGRIRRRLRALGVRRRIVATNAARGGWDALTQAERQVALLVAEGRTNREIAEHLFVSPHTVNTHLRHVFEKLAVHTRVELAHAATQQMD
ncbi:MAG TPA: LuxR C-terminal-related transcriptional regulator [Jatrophihabitans sp.]|jgi:DNA-binding CsgD family transcriptional regulator